MITTLNRQYAGFIKEAFITPEKFWVKREWCLNWEPDKGTQTTTPPSQVKCDLPIWFMKKHSIRPSIDELNDQFKGQRITIIDGEGEKYGGLVNYFTRNHFPEHGLLCYFGRRPVYNVNPLTIKIQKEPITVKS